MSSQRKKFLGIPLSLALLGAVALPYVENPVVVLLLFWGWGVMALYSTGVLLSGLLAREKDTWIFGLTGLLSTAIFFYGGFGFSGWLRHGKHQTAQALVMDLAAYHAREGRYPEQLSALGRSYALDGLIYSVHPVKKTYYFEYLMDGFNREYYDSAYQHWGTLGWND
jgi:hypothetical protein